MKLFHLLGLLLDLICFFAQHKKMKFFIEDFSSKCNQIWSDLVRFTGEILNGKLHCLCNVVCFIGISRFFKELAENVCHAFEAFS